MRPILLTSLWSVACAGPARPALPPRPASAQPAVVFSPPGPAATQYATRSTESPPPLAAAILAAIQRTAGRVPPWHGPLAAAAADLATIVPFEDYALIEFALHHNGVAEPTPRIFTIASNRRDNAALAQAVADAVTKLMGGREYQRIGIGVAERADHRAVVVALQEIYLHLSPVPRQVAAGGTVRLRGKLLPPFFEPQVFVTREEGAVQEVTVRAGRSAGFSVSIPCGQDSMVRIEISGVAKTGSSVLANFPVYCGRAPPNTLRTAQVARIDPEDTSAAEHRLVELINRDRARAGLSLLAVDAAVADVARRYSQEMAGTGRVVHVSPVSGSADDRLRAAGVPRPLVQENLAQAHSADEAHRNLMRSPGHRANILSERATHVGVGVVSSTSGLLVTELFTRVPPLIDPKRARNRVARRTRDALGVRIDSLLNQIAQSHAERVAAHGGGNANQIPNAAEVRRLDRFRQVTAMVVTLSDVDRFGTDRLPKETDATHVGVGVAQGVHEEFGEGTVFVVLLLARAR